MNSSLTPEEQAELEQLRGNEERTELERLRKKTDTKPVEVVAELTPKQNKIANFLTLLTIAAIVFGVYSCTTAISDDMEKSKSKNFENVGYFKGDDNWRLFTDKIIVGKVDRKTMFNYANKLPYTAGALTTVCFYPRNAPDVSSARDYFHAVEISLTSKASHCFTRTPDGKTSLNAVDG